MITSPSRWRLIEDQLVVCGLLVTLHPSDRTRMAEERSISVEEISKHNTKEDCWIVVDGKVWDITDFAPEHPGGGKSTLH